MLTAIDVCCGAGGLSLGLERAGFTVIAGVDTDEHAIETHRRNRGGELFCSDLKGWSPWHSADLVAGGVPCQSFSHAGDRGGLDDERGQLYLELLRIADEAQARCVLLENVRGLRTWRDSAGVAAVQRIAEAFTARGWIVAHAILNAADYGVPQFRQRLFLVGFRDPTDRERFRWPTPTHGPAGNLFGLPAWITVRQALGLGLAAFASGRLPGISWWQGGRLLDVDRPGYAIGTKGQPDLLDRPANTIAAGNDTYADGAAAAALHEAVEIAGLADRPATTVAADARLWPAGHHDEGTSKGGRNDRAVRLTVAQCAALQAFPHDWIWCGSYKHRQIGNAVPPPLGEAVGRSLAAAINGGIQ